MSKWCTIDREALEKEIISQDHYITAKFGKKPDEMGGAKFSFAEAIEVARAMGTRDALVHIHNCLSK